MKRFLTFISLLVISFSVWGCSSTIPRNNPAGERFPTVLGTSLNGEEIELPTKLNGEPSLLIVGYVQDAQFDIDRWLIGASMGKLNIPVLELPTIRGLAPRVIAPWIEQGMRDGIPKQDWHTVITVYSDADKIAALTGTEKPRNARVLLLNETGQIVWFHDDGFSASVLEELASKLATISSTN